MNTVLKKIAATFPVPVQQELKRFFFAYQIRKERFVTSEKEFALLEYLLHSKGKVCRRTRIIEKIWDIHFDKDTSVIDVFINSLRKKLDEPGKESFIKTIRGVGCSSFFFLASLSKSA